MPRWIPSDDLCASLFDPRIVDMGELISCASYAPGMIRSDCVDLREERGKSTCTNQGHTLIHLFMYYILMSGIPSM